MAVLFELDPTSTAQFASTSPSFSDGSGTPGNSSISATTLANRGPVLRMTGSGGTSSNCAIWPIATALDFEDLTRDFLVELEIANGVYGSGGYAGIALIDRVGTWHSFNHLAFGPAEWASRVDNGTRVTAGATGTTIGESGLARFWIKGRAQASAPPLLKSYLEGRGVGEVRGSGATSDNDSPARPFSAGTIEGASWNGLAVASIGLVLQSSGSNPLPTQVDVLAFRVIDDPLGDGGDDTAPTIANVSPASGSNITANQAISFDVTDETALTATWIAVTFAATGASELVYDGSAFSEQYDGSTVTPISGGFTFSISRTDGWLFPPTFTIKAYDGNESL
jgi:hypothetical protein